MGFITAFFPLHNENCLNGLDRAWHLDDPEDKEAQKIENMINENAV